jgi:hypothetical protein
MADIVAADVTNSIIAKLEFSQGGQSKKQLLVICEVTVDPGTTDAYPTGGIPLTNLFTAGEAADTGLDPAKPIRGVASEAKIDNAVTTMASCRFHNGGTTAADQKLVISVAGVSKRAAIRTSLSGTGIAASDANTITDSGNGLATFVVGEPLLVSGFTGTAANNQVAVVDTVAAGTMDVFVATALTADAAGETVTIRSLWPNDFVWTEHANTDITATGMLAAGDRDIVVTLWLFGTER